jgi:hypothetical protein
MWEPGHAGVQSVNLPAGLDDASTTSVLESLMAASAPTPVDSISEIIRLYKRDVDRSLLRRQLARTPEERFRDVMDRQAMVEELRRAGREARRSK